MKDGFTFLSGPYSDPDFEVTIRRMHQFSLVDAELIRMGYKTMSPLSKHYTRMAAGQAIIPGDWNFWGEYSCEMLELCKRMFIVTLDGWSDSEGVRGEYNHAKELGIPLFLVHPATLIIKIAY